MEVKNKKKEEKRNEIKQEKRDDKKVIKGNYLSWGIFQRLWPIEF